MSDFECPTSKDRQINYLQLGIVKYILIGLISVFIGHAQEYETIEWSADRKLSWNDFRGKAPENDRAAAITASGITYRFSTIYPDGELVVDFEVTTYFYPNQSWCRPNLCDSFILGHEQLHFDISELFAQKMRDRLAESSFTQNVQEEVKLIYGEILEELEVYQDLYDDQTNFSRDSVQQALWNKKIKDALHY